MSILPELQLAMATLLKEADQIPAERRKRLGALAGYLAGKKEAGQTARLNFICTHNSRRSHIAQVWAAAAAAYFGIGDMQTYSGGTEATAFNPRAVAALERVGFRIEKPGGDNPRYQVHYADGHPPLVCFSKVFDHPENPETNFAAIMTCSEADANCPFIPGAEWRLPLTYEDPKEADGTPEEAARYDERVRQIGREILFAFQSLHQQPAQ